MRVVESFVKYGVLSAFCLTLASMVTNANAAPKPKYSAKVPEFVTTPDKIETKTLGTLEFFDGMPNQATVSKVYDHLDLTRGITSFLDGIQITSMYALLRGLREAGVKPGEVGMTDTLLDARSLLLTPNTTTIYILSQIDLSDGPVVVNAPPQMLGFINDAAFEYVIDIGAAGPDKSKGGKFLILPPGYKGDIPGGYFVAKSKTFDHWLILRASVKDGDTATPVKMVKKHLNVYPLSKADNPPAEIFHNLSGKQFNTIHANNYHFYEELNEVIQKEPADAFPAELVGTFASIGIKKGQPFKPDARMKKILTEAAAIANATARALTFSPRKKNVFFYEDRQWNSTFAGGSHEFAHKGERVLDDRTSFHYYATGITPAMTKPAVGKGSVYAAVAKDSKGKYLDGGKTYKVTLPKPVPAKNFWSFMVYSGQHRSILETDQKSGGVDSKSPEIKANKDGTYTVWFGPKAPKGKEGNWVQTIPGKSYNVLLRVYGPLEPWFKKTWKPGDFELVK
jgi:hypothetical protein